MSNVKPCRPTPVLTTFASQGMNSDFNCSIPDGQIGSTSMLERLMLVIFARLSKANTIFEFGTYRGETTDLFISNNLCRRLLTIDLPLEESENSVSKDTYDLSIDRENDQFLTQNRAEDSDEKLKIKAKDLNIELELLKCDSSVLDTKPYLNSVDMIFIDGGHTLDLIKSDTENAFDMLTDNGIVLWHDYGSSVHGDVTEYLDTLANDVTLHAIGGTSLVAHVKNENLRSELFAL